MKPSILFSDTVAAIQRLPFKGELGSLPITVFQKGLGGAETVAIELLIADRELNDGDFTATNDADWVAVIEGTTTFALDTNNTVVALRAPGHYRLKTPATTAGAIVLGQYGH